MDKETIKIYDTQAQKYINLVSRDTPDRDLRAFMAAVTDAGHVLDLGCGPGNSSAIMQAAGYQITATDASAEMVKMAQEKFDVPAVQAVFDDLDEVDVFDGVWANFCLLHAPKAEFPRHLQAINTALRPGGILHLGLKLGSGEKRDGIGRLYSYFEEGELLKHLKDIGFFVIAKRQGTAEGLAGDVEPFIILLTQKHA